MAFSKTISAVLGAALVLTPATRAAADAADVFGGIVGGIIGGAIVNEGNKQRSQQRTVVRRTGISSVQRAQNREVQNSLNYFGFPAGVADGALGRRSRAAISQYQAFLQFPATGSLTQFERDILVGAYNRAQYGSADVMQVMATSQIGPRALLQNQKAMMTGQPTNGTQKQTIYAGMPAAVSAAIDEIANSSDPSAEQLLQRSGFIQLADLNADGNTDYIIDTAVSGSSFWCNAQTCKTLVFASTANGFARNDLLLNSPRPDMFNCSGGSCVVNATTGTAGTAPLAPAPQVVTPQEPPATVLAAAPPAPAPTEGTALAAFPDFMSGGDKLSLATHCNNVSLITNTNGGFTTAALMQDRNQALNEQFCLARTYAISEGEQLLTKITGFSKEQIEAQCGQLGAAMTNEISSLSLKPNSEVMADVSSFVQKNNISPAQMMGTAKVCLSVGYRTDDMDVAVGASLLLVALGSQPYAELLGHHLNNGIGATQRTDLAVAWYGQAIEALEGGAPAVFAPGQPERVSLLRKAAMLTEDTSGGATALPAFTVQQ